VLYDTIRQGAFSCYFDREAYSLYLVKKLQRQESSNQTFLIKESTNLESTVVPRAAVLFLILIVKKKM